MIDARREAWERLGGRFDVRVLEPSPPAVGDPPWFADDPVAGGEVVPLDRPGARSWASLVTEGGDEAMRRFCEARWLGPWRRLTPLPADFAAGRSSLHALGERVLAPARFAANGKIGLRWTRDGYGTPFFDADRQVRVAGPSLVDGDGAVPLDGLTLGAAAAFAAVPLAPWHGLYPATTPDDPSLAVAASPASVAALGDWFGFTTSVLEQLRSDLGVAASTRAQLWPEHFDLSISVDDATLGGSPGDAAHPEPYLYLSTFGPGAGPLWNEPFGASLPYAELLAADDQRAAALAFFRAALDSQA